MVLRQKYMEAVKADRFEELKKSLFQIIMHPEYNNSETRNDIALIKLAVLLKLVFIF